MSAPAWSVVVPTADRHETLARCLERLAPGVQTFDARAYEVIVSDDARSAETRTFIESRFPWARWTAGPARGPAANRNHGASLARGGWLAFTDDDTLPDPGWLAAFARAAAAPTKLATADALEGRTTCAAGFGTPMHYAPVNELGGRFWSCNVAVRADRFAAIGGFDEGFTLAHMEDQDLRERLAAAGVTIRWVPDAIVDHPPRRQPSGRRLGLLREAEVRYLYKHGAARPVGRRLLRGIALLRLGTIRSLPWSLDSVRARGSLASEMTTVMLHLGAWQRRAAGEFPSPAPQSVPQGSVTTGSATISVIVPAWRRPASLTRCLQALAAQTRPPDEVIVVTRQDDEATRAAARAVVFPVATRAIHASIAAPGVIAAMEHGLSLATGRLVALTDDDAEPRPDWIARLVATFATDARIGGVGGRDWQPRERGSAERVGRVQWFGRVVGRHHLGAGSARDVDVLKGVNCAFRAPLLRAVGFDARLRGSGAQMHWELGVCLPLRRAGWRLVYDPSIAVDHHVEVRAGTDQVHRGRFASDAYVDAVHNEALVIGEHLHGLSRAVFSAWSAVAGTTAAPGAMAALRLRAQGHAWAWDAWKASRAGRALARSTHARTSRSGVVVPAPGTLA